MKLASLKLIPIYLLYLTTLGLAAFSKLATLPVFGGNGTPQWFQAQFARTPLAAPGLLGMLFYLIALSETALSLGFLFSLLRQEFQPGREKGILVASLLGSAVLFVILGTGLRISQDFHGAAELAVYFVATLIALIYIELIEARPDLAVSSITAPRARAEHP